MAVATLLLLLCSLPATFILSSSADVPLGSTLHASALNNSWSSSNSTFYLGFVSVSDGLFLAAVRHSGDGVIVWSAGEVDAGGSLSLNASGSLRLVNGSGAMVWESRPHRLGVAVARVEDSGELVLRDNRKVRLWSSFDHPTDTIVPNQNFISGKTLRSGPYSFELQSNGNLTLKWKENIVYWNQGINVGLNVSLSSPSLVLQPAGTLIINDPSLIVSARIVFSSDYDEGNDAFRFLRLDEDGNLRIYVSDGNNGNAALRWAAVSDQCQVFGYCGDYGICSYKDTNPVCGCPSRNFELIDHNHPRKGCKRKLELERCPNNATMLELDKVVLLTFPPETSDQAQRFFVGTSSCKINCLNSESCRASVSMSDGSSICYMKQSGLVGGYQSPSLPSTSFLKVCRPILPNPPVAQKSKPQTWDVVLIAIVIIVGLLAFVVIEGIFCWFYRRNCVGVGNFSSQYTLLDYASGAPIQFSYKELRRCTKGFKERLGAGGFGSVYRGQLNDGSVVAVKQLEGIEQGEKHFRVEVATISCTHHLNLIRLIGFCSEGRHRLLVYEFLRYGSLDRFLFITENHSGETLTWRQRFAIAVGAAKGITYLNEECRDCIVHCDIKPENILLDESFNAKVSDFGLAKLANAMEKRDRTLSSIRGTRGYVAPEWLANLPITAKSDVYSYGMVLLEIVSGRRNFEVSSETNRKKFSLWAYEEFEKRNIHAIIDKRLEADTSVDINQVERVIQVSFWCIQEQPSQRPFMGKVVQMLEGITIVERPPAPMATATSSLSWNSLNVSSLPSLSSFTYPSASGKNTQPDVNASLLQLEMN